MTGESRAARRRRLTKGWTDEDRLADEDQQFAKTRWILQMQEAGEHLIAERERLAATQRDFTEANRARKASADKRAAIARTLSADGKSAADIAKLARVTRRTVERWLKRDIT